MTDRKGGPDIDLINPKKDRNSLYPEEKISVLGEKKKGGVECNLLYSFVKGMRRINACRGGNV